MRKLLIFAFVALSMFACTDQNAPDNGGSSSSTSPATVEGELTGVFSVSSTKKVHFSKGNLQYQASTNTWRFAENQYDIIGDANKNFSASYTGWIDLMGFGTTGVYCNPYDLEYYLPQYISANTIDNINGTRADWGEACTISNGGNKKGLWRTITGDEWNYLIKERKNSSQLQGTATVNGIRGKIILPDGWKTPSGIKWTGNPISANPWGTDWETNQYSATQWKKMEQNGAVFIPCGGCAVGRSMSSSYNGGVYWSASCKWSGYSYEGTNRIIIGDIGYAGEWDQLRFAVRLVKDISETHVNPNENGIQGNGKCGDNLTWDLKDGVLTISGSGDMDDFQWDNDKVGIVWTTAPWYEMREKITSVVINPGVTNIGELAFQGCSGLTSVTIPNSVTNIGNRAFFGCRGLTSVTIPNSVTSIGNRAFYGCSGLTSVTIPNSVTSIGSGAFYECSSLTEPLYNAHVFAYMPTSYSGAYTIPDGIESIAGGAFSSCSGLTSVTIPNSVTSIGIDAFYGCSGLTSVTIPNSVTSIGIDAFTYCSSLTSVTIPNSVTSIGSGAFHECSSLTSIEIPNSVTSIGDGAFQGCSSLTEPLYNAHVFAYMPTSYSGTYTIPDGIESIAGSSFRRCASLTSVTIPDSVTSIGNWAFEGSYRLTYVTIGNSVTSIGDGAFWGCSGLKSITCLASTPPSCGYNALEVVTSIPVYVPASSVDAYKNAAEWKNFTNILPIE